MSEVETRADAGKWRNRIIGYGEETPDQLLANPRNHRVHPKYQQDAFLSVAEEIGIVQDVIVNQRTGFIVDGHMRVVLALRKDQPSIPVKYVDLSPNEEAIILATFDNISAMATTDRDLLEELLREANTTSDDLQSTLALVWDMHELDEHLASAADDDDDEEDLMDVSAELPGAHALKADMHFESSELWNIPPLLPDMLAEMPEGVVTWAGRDASDPDAPAYFYNFGTDSVKGLDLSRTVIGFYTEDHRFEQAWDKPDEFAGKMLNRAPLAMVTSNYSMFWSSPAAVKLWNTYRARWVGRYLQEAGIRVIPDVNFGHEDTFEYCLAGIPQNAPCISVQGQNTKTDEEIRVQRLAVRMAIERLKPQSLFLYCGANTLDVLSSVIPKSLHLITVDNRVAIRRKIMDEK